MSEETPPSKPKRSPDEPRGEKDEKDREKESEKSQGYAEKYRSDPVGALVWPAILILAGIVFLLDNVGALPRIGSSEPWHWIAIGVGVILLVEVGVRSTSPDYARPVAGRLILAVVMFVVGLSGIFEDAGEIFWPLALILIGAAILASMFFRRQ